MKKVLLMALSVLVIGAVAANADDKKDGKKGEGKASSKVLEKYDKNKDGKLDDSEKEAMQKDRKAEMIKKYDKDGDGKLSDSEKEAAKEAHKKGDKK